MTLIWKEDAHQMHGIYTRIINEKKTKTGREYCSMDLNNIQEGMLECRQCWSQCARKPKQVYFCSCGGRLFPLPKSRKMKKDDS